MGVDKPMDKSTHWKEILIIEGVLFGLISAFKLDFSQINGIIEIIILLLIVVPILIWIYFLYKYKRVEQWIKTIYKAIKGQVLPDFFYNSEEGKLFYGKHKIQHIALRLDTINTVINCIQNHEMFSKEHSDVWENSIKNCGKNVGSSFGEAFKEELNPMGVRPSNKEIIDIWKNHDSKAGLGKLDYDCFDVLTFKGHIRIKNCFLCFDKTRVHSNCKFMEGYMEGLIFNIFGEEINVKFDHIEPNNYCSFEIFPEELSEKMEYETS